MTHCQRCQRAALHACTRELTLVAHAASSVVTKPCPGRAVHGRSPGADRICSATSDCRLPLLRRFECSLRALLSALSAWPFVAGQMHRQLRVCRTPGCSFQILGRRHRHCCSMCNTTDRSLHGDRCRQVQLLLAGAAPDTFAPGRCQSEQCGREANWGYRSCCITTPLLLK